MRQSERPPSRDPLVLERRGPRRAVVKQSQPGLRREKGREVEGHLTGGHIVGEGVLRAFDHGPGFRQLSGQEQKMSQIPGLGGPRVEGDGAPGKYQGLTIAPDLPQ